MRQQVPVNMCMPQKIEESKGQIKARWFTGPGAVLEDKGQVATAIHQSAVTSVSHPSQHAPTAQPLSGIKDTAQKSFRKLTHLEQMQNMELSDHTGIYSGCLGAFAHQVQRRPQ